MLDLVNSTIRVTIQGTGSELEVSKRRLEDSDEMSRTWTNPLTQATGGPPQPVRGSLGVSVPPTERDAPDRSHVSMGPPSPSLRDAEARSSTPGDLLDLPGWFCAMRTARHVKIDWSPDFPFSSSPLPVLSRPSLAALQFVFLESRPFVGGGGVTTLPFPTAHTSL